MTRLHALRAALTGPSLVRRLVGLQCLLLVVAWMTALLAALYQMRFGPSDLDADVKFDTILSVAEGLADRPDALSATLSRIDRFFRDESGGAAPSDWPYCVMVFQGDRLMFASPMAPLSLARSSTGRIETSDIGGQVWRARTRRSARSDISVTLAQRADLAGLGVGLMSMGALVAPLLLALPWVVVPAWISTRIALRPLRRLVAEVGSRGPRNLEPLTCGLRHHELQALVDKVNRLLQDVRDANAREQLFIADAAHELRTPLAAAQLNAEALLQRADSAAQRELVGGIVRSVGRAGRLASQLLALMRSDCALGQASGVRFDLNQLVRERICQLEPLAGNRDVALHVDCERELTMIGDTESMQSLIDNLVDNAVKFSAPGSVVTVRTDARDDSGQLIVADRGPGVPADLTTRIFDRFFRAPGQDCAGSGLGLAIVKSIVERHQGSVDATTTPGGGLTVVVTLPRVPQDKS